MFLRDLLKGVLNPLKFKLITKVNLDRVDDEVEDKREIDPYLKQHSMSVNITDDNQRDLDMDKRYVGLLALLAAFVALLALAFVGSTSSTASSLVKVFICFRHGSRAPDLSYTNDPYDKDDKRYWPEGAGQLTKAGKSEEYELGKNLRKRYGEFIGDFYNSNDIVTFSQMKERCLMSAELFLAGFFPPRGYQEWSVDIPWQPIPVYPEKMNNGFNGFHCPRLMAGTYNYHQQNLTTAYGGFNEDEIMLLKENLRRDRLQVGNLFILWEAAFFQDRAKLPLPEWLSHIYQKRLKSWAVDVMKFSLASTHDRWLLILGPSAKILQTFFTDSTRKLEIHSWIDQDLLSLLLVLGVEVDFIPEPSSAIAVELHNLNGEDYFEVHYYTNSKTTDPEQLTMKCGRACTLSQLRNISETLEIDDYMGYCNSGEPPISWKDFEKSDIFIL